MKKPNMKRWVSLAALIMAVPGSALMADQALYTFDSDITGNTGTGGDYAAMISQRVWSPENSPDSPAGGSEYVVIDWDAAAGSGYHEVQLSFDLGPLFPWPGLSTAPFVNIEFDLKIDVANSSLGLDNNYGNMQAVFQSWPENIGWSERAVLPIANTGEWQTYSTDIAGFNGAHLSQLVLRLLSSGGGYVTNKVAYWIDNIRLTSPPLPPPTLGKLERMTGRGLALIPGTSSQWQRVMVYPQPNTLGSDFGWFNRGNPVSYSITFSNFPTVNDYAANIFLVPNAHMQWGVADTSIDWNATNGLFFNITASTNNPATNWNVNLSAKTNLNAGNPNLTLVVFDYPTLPNGKWTLRFDNNTDFTIIAPNGFTTNGTLPADVAELVSGNGLGDTSLTPYLGIMPRTTEHIGVPAFVGRIEITGVPNPVDDQFNAPPLNADAWAKLADYQPGILIMPNDLLYTLSWNTPNDQGFQSLAVKASLTDPWTDLVPSTDWLFINGVRKALITESAVTAAIGNSPDAFFGLTKRVFTKLQILLPGETAAPGTPTGKTGTPTTQQVGSYFEVTVRAVDQDWYPITGVTDQISLSSTEPSFSWSGFPRVMVDGVATFTLDDVIQFGEAGTFTITATDGTDPTKTEDTSSPLTVVTP